MTKPKTRRRTGSASTINPDHIGMHRFIVVGVTVSLLAAVLTSWSGLVWVGKQQLLGESSRWLTPVMIDVPLILLTLARGALLKRGIRKRGLLVGIVFLTGYSSLANLLHTVAETGLDDLSSFIGTLTNALAPWLILSMTEVLWLIVTRPIRPRAKAARGTRSKARRAPVRAASPVRREQQPITIPTSWGEA